MTRLTGSMLPEVREALLAVVVREERLDEVGGRLSTYTDGKIRSAIALTFLRIGLRQLVEAARGSAA